ncbi:hypothetical protein PhaeoP72_01223 [Phaeobacter inhibens]|uniref:hypothetical protein n=1 Tax=Phaeobacter inhibens TaxID=221822 RepID=UPI000CA1C44B|nr:hypothetical protein [Phaeobacter inhibens]AUR03208.1 hypothetical protein PhaeoP72_01223 [Phaeobacter inhibens]
MNWKTEKILEDAKEVISDEGVFSEAQISALQSMVDLIGKAIEQEKPIVNYDRY